MKRGFYFSFIITILFFVSCKSENKTHEASEAILQFNKFSEATFIEDNSNILIEADKAIDSFNVIHINTGREGIINNDCDYYIYGKTAGRLLHGQHIIILDRYEPAGFCVNVEIETNDGTIKGYVDESNIAYLKDNRHNLWFKNVMLTREYNYTGTVDDIYTNSGYSIGVDKERSLRLWRIFYSEMKMRISDNYLVIGDNEDSVIYRLETIAKSGNTYIIDLSNLFDEEYEIILVDVEDGIIITNYKIKTEGAWRDFFAFSLNFKYVPYDSEKSEITKKAVIEWIDQQLAILTRSAN